MKKRLLLILLAIILLPITVNAKEYCTIVKGGKTVGSEIKCGDEHFYVIGAEGDNLKLLAKYNLNVGYIYDYVNLSEERYAELQNEYGTQHTGYWSWDTDGLLTEPEFQSVKDFPNLYIIDDEYSHRFSARGNTRDAGFLEIPINSDREEELRSAYYTCGDEYVKDGQEPLCWDTEGLFTEPEFAGIDFDKYYFAGIEYNQISFYEHPTNVKQDPQYIGAHGTEPGKPDYPEYGAFSISASDIANETLHWSEIATGYGDHELTYITQGESGLFAYEKYLKKGGYNVKSINLITTDEIDNVVYSATNSHLPFNDWEWTYYSRPDSHHDSFSVLGNLKDYVPAEYNWLYSTTYYTRTTYAGTDSHYDEVTNIFFIDTLGNFCNGSTCSISLGAGIRPVITVPREDVKYNIEVETTGDGEIEVASTSAAGGEAITFIVKANKDYRLVSLTITTESGETIEFTEEDITENEDGTISISTNKFTMPYESVKLKATWEPITEEQEDINPQTFDNIYLYLGIFILSGVGLFSIRKQILKN